MTGLHDRPTAAELVEAVRELLEGQVLPEAPAHRAFHVRVAVNALRIVERELAARGSDAQDHAARLDALGFADDAELAVALRQRAVPADRLPAVRDAVLAAVEAKLAVANPRYLRPSPD